jgi:hypothetical protein
MPDLTITQTVLVAAVCLFNGALVGLSIYIVHADRPQRGLAALRDRRGGRMTTNNRRVGPWNGMTSGSPR